MEQNNTSPLFSTNLYYKQSSIETPFPLTEEFLTKLFSPENIRSIINLKTIQRISPYLPSFPRNLIESPENFSTLLTKTTTKFTTPIKTFYSMYTNGFFTENYQKNRPIFQEACLSEFIEQYKYTLKNLEQIKNNSTNEKEAAIDNIITFDMHSELASSGYSSVDSNRDTQSVVNDSFIKDRINYSFEKKEPVSSIKKKLALSATQSNDSGDEFSMDNNILQGERFQNLKKNKNQVTIKPRTSEEVKDFQRQEVERYKHPRQPWEYTLLDGTKCVVGPLLKKAKGAINTKARDHILLKQDRPSYITILALVRDAASKLQDGVGTRADICDLLKDSQYINENLLDSQINSIVSGALDRLHYEKDPCVKYDLHRKLWIYLHRNRTIDYPAWQDIDDKEGDKSLMNDTIGIDEELDDNENVKIDIGRIIIRKEALNAPHKNHTPESTKQGHFHHSLGKKHLGGDFPVSKNSKKKHKI